MDHKFNDGDEDKVDKSPTMNQRGKIDVGLIRTPKTGHIGMIFFNLALPHLPNAVMKENTHSESDPIVLSFEKQGNVSPLRRKPLLKNVTIG